MKACALLFRRAVCALPFALAVMACGGSDDVDQRERTETSESAIYQQDPGPGWGGGGAHLCDATDLAYCVMECNGQLWACRWDGHAVSCYCNPRR
jgi:hypothetical protein